MWGGFIKKQALLPSNYALARILLNGL